MTDEMSIDDYKQELVRQGVLSEWTADEIPDEMDAADYLDQFGKSKEARNQLRGSDGEKVAIGLLRGYGVKMAERIATPIVILSRDKKGFVLIEYDEPVSGDIVGVMGDGSGRRVLAEVKTTEKDRIPFSYLEKHQVNALNENHLLGAVSLFVAVFEGYGAYVLRWPIDGFVFRTSLKRETAMDNQWDGAS